MQQASSGPGGPGGADENLIRFQRDVFVAAGLLSLVTPEQLSTCAGIRGWITRSVQEKCLGTAATPPTHDDFYMLGVCTGCLNLLATGRLPLDLDRKLAEAPQAPAAPPVVPVPSPPPAVPPQVTAAAAPAATSAATATVPASDGPAASVSADTRPPLPLDSRSATPPTAAASAPAASRPPLPPESRSATPPAPAASEPPLPPQTAAAEASSQLAAEPPAAVVPTTSLPAVKAEPADTATVSPPVSKQPSPAHSVKPSSSAKPPAVSKSGGASKPAAHVSAFVPSSASARTAKSVSWVGGEVVKASAGGQVAGLSVGATVASAGGVHRASTPTGSGYTGTPTTSTSGAAQTAVAPASAAGTGAHRTSTPASRPETPTSRAGTPTSTPGRAGTPSAPAPVPAQNLVPPATAGTSAAAAAHNAAAATPSGGAAAVTHKATMAMGSSKAAAGVTSAATGQAAAVATSGAAAAAAPPVATSDAAGATGTASKASPLTSSGYPAGVTVLFHGPSSAPATNTPSIPMDPRKRDVSHPHVLSTLTAQVGRVEAHSSSGERPPASPAVKAHTSPSPRKGGEAASVHRAGDKGDNHGGLSGKHEPVRFPRVPVAEKRGFDVRGHEPVQVNGHKQYDKVDKARRDAKAIDLRRERDFRDRKDGVGDLQDLRGIGRSREPPGRVHPNERGFREHAHRPVDDFRHSPRGGERSRERERERDFDRGRDRDRDRGHGGGRDYHRGFDWEHERDWDREHERDWDRERDWDWDRDGRKYAGDRRRRERPSSRSPPPRAQLDKQGNVVKGGIRGTVRDAASKGVSRGPAGATGPPAQGLGQEIKRKKGVLGASSPRSEERDYRGAPSAASASKAAIASKKKSGTAADGGIGPNSQVTGAPAVPSAKGAGKAAQPTDPESQPPLPSSAPPPLPTSDTPAPMPLEPASEALAAPSGPSAASSGPIEDSAMPPLPPCPAPLLPDSGSGHKPPLSGSDALASLSLRDQSARQPVSPASKGQSQPAPQAPPLPTEPAPQSALQPAGKGAKTGVDSNTQGESVHTGEDTDVQVVERGSSQCVTATKPVLASAVRFNSSDAGRSQDRCKEVRVHLPLPEDLSWKPSKRKRLSKGADTTGLRGSNRDPDAAKGVAADDGSTPALEHSDLSMLNGQTEADASHASSADAGGASSTFKRVFIVRDPSANEPSDADAGSIEHAGDPTARRVLAAGSCALTGAGAANSSQPCLTLSSGKAGSVPMTSPAPEADDGPVPTPGCSKPALLTVEDLLASIPILVDNVGVQPPEDVQGKEEALAKDPAPPETPQKVAQEQGSVSVQAKELPHPSHSSGACAVNGAAGVGEYAAPSMLDADVDDDAPPGLEGAQPCQGVSQAHSAPAAAPQENMVYAPVAPNPSFLTAPCPQYPGVTFPQMHYSIPNYPFAHWGPVPQAPMDPSCWTQCAYYSDPQQQHHMMHAAHAWAAAGYPQYAMGQAVPAPIPANPALGQAVAAPCQAPPTHGTEAVIQAPAEPAPGQAQAAPPAPPPEPQAPAAVPPGVAQASPTTQPPPDKGQGNADAEAAAADPERPAHTLTGQGSEPDAASGSCQQSGAHKRSAAGDAADGARPAKEARLSNGVSDQRSAAQDHNAAAAGCEANGEDPLVSDGRLDAFLASVGSADLDTGPSTASEAVAAGKPACLAARLAKQLSVAKAPKPPDTAAPAPEADADGGSPVARPALTTAGSSQVLKEMKSMSRLVRRALGAPAELAPQLLTTQASDPDGCSFSPSAGQQRESTESGLGSLEAAGSESPKTTCAGASTQARPAAAAAEVAVGCQAAGTSHTCGVLGGLDHGTDKDTEDVCDMEGSGSLQQPSRVHEAPEAIKDEHEAEKHQQQLHDDATGAPEVPTQEHGQEVPVVVAVRETMDTREVEGGQRPLQPPGASPPKDASAAGTGQSACDQARETDTASTAAEDTGPTPMETSSHAQSDDQRQPVASESTSYAGAASQHSFARDAIVDYLAPQARAVAASAAAVPATEALPRVGLQADPEASNGIKGRPSEAMQGSSADGEQLQSDQAVYQAAGMTGPVVRVGATRGRPGVAGGGPVANAAVGQLLAVATGAAHSGLDLAAPTVQKASPDGVRTAKGSGGGLVANEKVKAKLAAKMESLRAKVLAATAGHVRAVGSMAAGGTVSGLAADSRAHLTDILTNGGMLGLYSQQPPAAAPLQPGTVGGTFGTAPAWQSALQAVPPAQTTVAPPQWASFEPTGPVALSSVPGVPRPPEALFTAIQDAPGAVVGRDGAAGCTHAVKGLPDAPVPATANDPPLPGGGDAPASLADASITSLHSEPSLPGLVTRLYSSDVRVLAAMPGSSRHAPGTCVQVMVPDSKPRPFEDPRWHARYSVEAAPTQPPSASASAPTSSCGEEAMQSGDGAGASGAAGTGMTYVVQAVPQDGPVVDLTRHVAAMASMQQRPRGEHADAANCVLWDGVASGAGCRAAEGAQRGAVAGADAVERPAQAWSSQDVCLRIDSLVDSELGKGCLRIDSLVDSEQGKGGAGGAGVHKRSPSKCAIKVDVEDDVMAVGMCTEVIDLCGE